MNHAVPHDRSVFPRSAYYTELSELPDSGNLGPVAERVFRQVFRHDFTAPGTALLSLDADVGSVALRRLMVALKESLDGLYRERTGQRLAYLSMARFDQQVTTKFHLDGAPEE